MAASMDVMGLAVTMVDIIYIWTGSRLSKPRCLTFFMSILSFHGILISLYTLRGSTFNTKM
jgi:hypothetical protein